MEYLAAGFSSLISVFVLAVFVAGVMKLFQIHTVLTEIKDGLRSAPPIARTPTSFASPSYNAPAVPTTPAALHTLGSGDDMLRALDAQMKWDESSSRTQR